MKTIKSYRLLFPLSLVLLLIVAASEMNLNLELRYDVAILLLFFGLVLFVFSLLDIILCLAREKMSFGLIPLNQKFSKTLKYFGLTIIIIITVIIAIILAYLVFFVWQVSFGHWW